MSASCQGNYPALIVNKGDTVVAFSLPQAREIAASRYALDACDSGAAAMQAEITAHQALEQKDDSLFDAAQEEMKGYDAEVVLLNNQIRNVTQQGAIDLKIEKRKKTVSVISGVAATAVGTCFGALAGFLSRK